MTPRISHLALACAWLAATPVLAQESGSAPVQPEQTPEDVILVYGRMPEDRAFSVPQSVAVLDRALIEESAAETVGDALRFVPGASRDGSALDAFGDTYLIRGFEANQTLNGIYANSLRQARDSVAVERVEVLKGPASVLYGQLQPGAVVNIVTKQPEREFSGEASLAYGRYDDWRGTLDLTGPLAANGDVRFRLTGAWDNADGFVDHWHRDHVFIAPVLAFDLGEATTLTVESFYMRNELDGFLNGLPAEGTVLANPNGPLPRSLGLTDPTVDPSIRENSDIAVRLDHRINDRAQWRAALSWTREETDEAGMFGLFGWDEEFRTLTRLLLAAEAEGDTWTAHSDFALDFETGDIPHALVMGGDHTWFDREGERALFFAPSLDVYNPVYETAAAPDLVEVASYARTTTESTRTGGLFAQDRIELGDRLRAVVGVRWSHYEQDDRTVRHLSGATGTTQQTQTAWTSQLGLVYSPADNVALFANRTTSFLPVEGIAADGSALEPETGTQYELGARAELAGGRLRLDAALFHLTRGDVVVSDRDNPGFDLSIGEQVAKGLEVSAAFMPSDGLTLQAGYAYTDAETTEDTDTALLGARIRNVPAHSAVFRADHEWRAGPLAGLSLGGSATYTGDRAADIEDTFELPAYWRLDARAGYAVSETVEVALNVENLTDERYYTHAFSLFEVWPGAPRTWRVSLKMRM